MLYNIIYNIYCYNNNNCNYNMFNNNFFKVKLYFNNTEIFEIIKLKSPFYL